MLRPDVTSAGGLLAALEYTMPGRIRQGGSAIPLFYVSEESLMCAVSRGGRGRRTSNAVAAIVCIILGASVVLALMQFIDHKLNQSAENQVLAFTEQAASNVADRMAMKQNALGAFAVQSSDPAELVPALNALKQRNGFAHVAAVDLTGQGFLEDGTPFFSEVLGQEETALSQGTQAYSDTFVNNEGVRVRLAQRPLFLDGQQSGALYVEIPLDLFTMPAKLNMFDGRGYFMLFEARTGEILVSPDEPTKTPIGERMSLFDFLDEAARYEAPEMFDSSEEASEALLVMTANMGSDLRGLEDAVAQKHSGLTTAAVDGKASYVCVAPVGTGWWYACGIVPMENVRAEASFVTTSFLVVILIMLACLAAVGLLVISAYRKRLRERHVAMMSQLYDALSESIDLAVNLYSPADGKVTPIVEKAADIIGYRLTDFLHDERLSAAIGLSDADAALFDRIRTGRIESAERGEIPFFCARNGREQWVGYSVSPLIFDGKHQLLVVLQDKTAEKAIQLSMKDAMHAAEAANEAKSEFLSRMSHEIRTPMNVIIGMLQIAHGSLDDVEKMRACLVKIGAASDHLLGLINDVLDISKIENGKMTFSSEPFRLASVLAHAITVARVQSEQKGQKLTVSVPDHASCVFVGDPVRMKQLLINLLTNAVKYTPEGGRIEFDTNIAPGAVMGYRQLTFVVSDNGIGMSKEFLEHVFEPFTMEGRSREQGTGLGMSIVRNIVTMMGGSLNVESELDHGSTFTVTLNLRIALEAERKAFEEAEGFFDAGGTMQGEGNARSQGDSGEKRRDVSSAVSPDGPDGSARGTHGAKCGSGGACGAFAGGDAPGSSRGAGPDFGVLPKSGGAPSDVSLTSERVGPPPAIDRGELRGLRVLLAEDNDLNAEIACELLSESGLVVDRAVDGEKACGLFEASPVGTYDAVLMDVQMPRRDGYEATRCIRALDRPDAASVPIIAMSANAFSDDVRASLASGMNMHLSKPIDMRQVLSAIVRLVRKRRADEGRA